MQINRNIISSKNYITIGLLFLMIVLVFHIELQAQEVDSKGKSYNIQTTLTSLGEKLDSKSEILFSNSAAEMQKGEYEKAILYLDQLIKLNPELEQAYCSRGVAYRRINNYQQALNDFNIAIKINPNLAEAYLSRGILLLLTNELNKALGDFNQALRINQDDPQAYLNRGLAYKKLNNKEAAIQDYNKAIRLDPTYLEAYQNRFILYASIGKNEAALFDCNKMIELNPLDGYLFFLRANLFYHNFNDKLKACKDWSKSIELGYNKAVIDYSNYCK